MSQPRRYSSSFVSQSSFLLKKGRAFFEFFSLDEIVSFENYNNWGPQDEERMTIVREKWEWGRGWLKCKNNFHILTLKTINILTSINHVFPTF